MSAERAKRTSTQSRVRLINPEDLVKPSGFSHSASAAGTSVWISGQISCDRSGRPLHKGDMAAQFVQALNNLAKALHAAGCDPTDVTKITYFVTDIQAYKEAVPSLGKPYREIFGRHFPAATLVQVAALMEPEAMIEIECVAVTR